MSRSRRKTRRAGLLVLGDPVYERPDKPIAVPTPQSGLLVKLVVPGSNADTRGLKPGDVLLSYNGTKLVNREDLKAMPAADRTIPVDFWRGGKEGRIEVVPGKLGVVLDSRPAPLAIAEDRRLRQALRAAQSGGEEFDRLPATRNEAEALAKLFRSDDRPARILLGTDASEPELDRLASSGEMGRFGVIHLATHAVIDDRVPASSAAILTLTGLPDPLEQVLNKKPAFDGRLSVREIQRGWELHAELVTLSACETALGRDAGGEGFVGFTQALLISGARTVCLSLWKVDDLATSLLMKRFYQNWLGKRTGMDRGMSKAEALNEAKRWMRHLTTAQRDHEIDEITRGPRDKRKSLQATALHPYAHPYYWAGFILVGDPD